MRCCASMRTEGAKNTEIARKRGLPAPFGKKEKAVSGNCHSHLHFDCYEHRVEVHPQGLGEHQASQRQGA